jgi:hypothetical protein
MASKIRLLLTTLMSIVFLVFLVGFVSAYSWENYGASTRMDITNTQFSNIYLPVNDTSISTQYPLASTNGITTQILTREINRSNIIFTQVGTYTKVLNQNLVELFEFNNNGSLQGQNFYSYKASNILTYYGLYSTSNTSILAYRAYDINLITRTASLVEEQNVSFSGETINTNGIKCADTALYFGNTRTCFSYIYNSTATKLYKFWNNGTYATNNYVVYNPTAPSQLPDYIDADNDGRLEYIFWNANNVTLFDDDVRLYQYNRAVTNGATTYAIYDAKFFINDAMNCAFWIWGCVPYTTQTFNIAILEASPTGGYGGGNGASGAWITYVRADGSIYNSVNRKAFFGGATIGDYTQYPSTLNIADMNNDGFEEINVALKQYNQGSFTGNYLYTLNRYGDKIKTNSYGVLGTASGGDIIAVRIDNSDLLNDLYITASGTLFNERTNATISTGFSSPSRYVPTDIDTDGFYEMIGYDSSNKITIYDSNITNQNAVIANITLSPSSNIVVLESLSVTISATDYENDVLYYSVDCGNNESITEDGNQIKSCVYSSVGVYQLIAKVRDIYHSTYSSYTIPIYVTASSQTCNYNGICESGENNINCPNDCFAPIINVTQSETGGIPIPTQLVDTEGNTETGLLPEIYYGILGFLSNTLQPMIIIVFVIIFVFIMLAIGALIRKFADKIGG